MTKKALKKADGTVIALFGDDVSYAPRGTAAHYNVAVEAPGDFSRTSQISVLPSGVISISNTRHTYHFSKTEGGLVHVCNGSTGELDEESRKFLEYLLKEQTNLFEKVRDVRRSFVG